MRNLILAAALCATAAPAFAQTKPATPVAPAAKVKYSTADTEIGTLLDDPAAKAIIDKNIPELTKSDQIDMARSMTLKGIQQYAPDTVTDSKLAAIDADFAKMPK